MPNKSKPPPVTNGALKSKPTFGNRFLCVEGGLLFVGPSGIGKSSAGMQQDICWALGRPADGRERSHGKPTGNGLRRRTRTSR
jgi:hypothetical protein